MPHFITTRPGTRTAVVCALLFCGTVLLFSRVLEFGFINYDDPSYVTDNVHVQGGLSWGGVVWAFTAATDYWHPLTWLSHMLDWQLYGANAYGHHLTSIVWHALNSVLVFLVFHRLAGGFWPSVFAAALFAWHPLRVESVVWITERKDVMSGCFFLLTLLAYAHFVDRLKSGGRWWPGYLLTLLCFAAGLMSKPMIVTLPLVLLILDGWPFGRCGSPACVPRLLIEKLPFFALSGAAAIMTVLLQRREGAFVLELSYGARAGNAVVSIVRYLGKLFWPFDLIVCYPHPGSWPLPTVLIAAALVLCLCWLAWQQRRARPCIATGWLWFLVTLLPVIGLVQVGFQAMADRYSYIPMLGLEFALIWSVGPILDSARVRLAAALAGTIVLAALCVRTWNQEAVWRDSVSLFEHAVEVSDKNGVAEDFLASALFAANRIDEAAGHAERACALNPRSDTALVNFAGIRERQGRCREAIDLYRKAIELRPGSHAVRMQLGLLELASGRVEEARRLMAAALHAAPALRGRTVELGNSAVENHDARSAYFFYTLVLAEFPNDAEAHALIGSLFVRMGDREKGLGEWRRALELDPNLPGLREQLTRLSEQR